MATQAQLDEKARQDRAGAANPVLESLATPAQLAEKTRGDSASSFATPAQLAEKRGRPGAPPLPPRQSSSTSIQTSAPPPYSADDEKRSALISEQWRSRDPRSSSTHSLVPSESRRGGRRTLLLIFIHGFMGNETSFQSFPAHVHNLLTIALAETHVVHTKIYPRYKSRKVIEFARDDFSNWLEPHENDSTDVVLLGHSMGGILAAEVALQKPVTMATGQAFRHRVVGTMNFDTPFLGMHPGVVLSGLGSLFRPAPDPPGSRQQSVAGSDYASSQASTSQATLLSDGSSQTTSTSPLASPPTNDPFFNPPYANDVRIADRKGWSNVLHFVNKHSDGLASATKQYVMSHLEFGGAMADYPGLKNRYARIRALEDVDDITRRSEAGYQAPARRIRFVNYYTASTGIPKVPKAPKSPEIPPGQTLNDSSLLQTTESDTKSLIPSSSRTRSTTPTPRISIDEHHDGIVTPKKLEEPPEASPISPVGTVEEQIQNMGEGSGVHNEEEDLAPMRHIDSMPIADDDDSEPVLLLVATTESNDEFEHEGSDKLQQVVSDPDLPPIPPIPREPEPVDLEAYTDKDSRKLAEREQKRVLKLYNQQVKDRESAIKDRKRFMDKRDKKEKLEREKATKSEEKQKLKGEKGEEKQRLKEEKEEEKQKLKEEKEEQKQRLKEEKDAEKQRLKQEKDEEKRQASISPPQREESNASIASSTDNKPKRDKKFCMLPPEHGGQRDKTWIRIYMEGVDEVGAHCGLFFPGPQYESLVGDVGDRITKWVEEDATRRAIADAERGY